MAKVLVAGVKQTWMERSTIDRLVQILRSAGHDATTPGDAQDVHDCDALVAVLDHADAATVAAAATAAALDKPVLVLGSQDERPPMQGRVTHVHGDIEAWEAALPAFYEAIKPFAGRMVRDQIPELVKAAGHDVTFRQLSGDEKPRFLKQKIHTEAAELLKADVGGEKEEVADLLEALEAFIAARGFDRDDLRRIKEHKRKQRGGFQRGFVVEATSSGAAQEEPAPEPPVEAPADPEAPLAADQQVRGQFFEI